LFNDKIKRGWEGRKQSLEIVKSTITKQDKVLWMHAASLGEYEQGLPVLEKLKGKFPAYKILITFFSPSGYDNVIKKKHIADAICYLPFDKKSEISRFVEAVHPEIFFTVKYDFWYHLLAKLKQQDAKVFVVSALFYETQVYFKFYGKWFVEQLQKNVDWIFHQTKHSYVLAKSIGFTKASVSGDTRFDRVKQIKERDNFVEFIEEFKAGKNLLVFGSSWEAEEKVALMILQKRKDFKIIIAPHDLKRVEHLKKIFPKAILYSEIANKAQQINDFTSLPILIIDCIGLLSKIYSYADLAVVGGGFHGKGLHNILEAATFGIPVFFGNHYRKNPEADALIAQNGGRSFKDEWTAADFIVELVKEDASTSLSITTWKQMGENAGDFVYQQPNASEIILKKITEM
jgi:3-deoxy-D-manno-octulosonic-acid transferase